MNSPHLSKHVTNLTMLLLAMHAFSIDDVRAHGKGMYKTQAEAEQRAKELNCKGTHENNGKWMPCLDEADLHRALRKQ